ncbi:hypothetical protein [Paludibacterium paludis]|uniref:hypothetical protein n=1 Tax=Paludibacterium paludis TaxID=1225769 RepID=UPI0016745790|nr:hypothetical protein [Paludibacterium paludis]
MTQWEGRRAAVFRFEYLFRCVSLGRQVGLIQFADGADAPRWKAFIREATLTTLGLEPAPAMPVFPPLALMPRLLRTQRFPS